MNVTDRARAAIRDIALRNGVDCPLVRVKLSYPQPGVRLISAEFANDYNINSHCDYVDEIDNISFVIDHATHASLTEATLDIGYNNQFFVKWKKESVDELHPASSNKNRRNRKKRGCQRRAVCKCSPRQHRPLPLECRSPSDGWAFRGVPLDIPRPRSP